MKKILYSFFFVLSCSLTQAQITLTTANMPVAPWVNVMAKDTQTGAVNWGNKGANQTYNFGSFQRNVPDTAFYLTPTSTQLATVPGATLAITGDRSTYLFGKNSAAKFDFEGLQTTIQGANILVAFNPVDDNFRFPTQYNGQFAGTYGFNKTLPGSAVGQPSVNQVRVTNTTTYTDTIDGWGKVTTPVGSYKCLRQKRKENSSTRIEFDLTGFGIWTTYTTINSNTVKYFYLTKETHGTVISFNYDSANNPISASWSLTPPAAPVAHFGHTTGAGGTVALHDSTDGYPDTYSWNFGDNGPTSSAQSPNHTYAVNGTYYVCLTVTNAGGSNTWCDSVRVTNATGSLNPPLAVNDTATLRQPASVTIRATTNDINYVPADTLCVATVWGAPAGWATIQGCGNIVYHPLDSNHIGVDTFYYRVCDNGTQLCDTGLVIVNVLPLKPRAAFTYQVLNCNGDIFRNASQHDVTTTWEIKTLYVANVFDTVISNVDTFHFNAGGSIRFNYNFPIQVCLTVSNGYGDVAQKCDTIYQACTGIESIEVAKVSIYPNPANDKVMIDLSKADENTIKEIQAVELYNILGEKLKTVSVNGSSVTIAVSDLTAGTYLVGLRSGGQSKMIVGKVMIAR